MNSALTPKVNVTQKITLGSGGWGEIHSFILSSLLSWPVSCLPDSAGRLGDFKHGDTIGLPRACRLLGRGGGSFRFLAIPLTPISGTVAATTDT